jgi:asparagine synthase (glutamine-hydrolysing)
VPELVAVYDARGIADRDQLLRNIEITLAPAQDCQVIKQSSHEFVAVNVLKPFSFATKQPIFQGDACLLIDGAFYDDRPISELAKILVTGNPKDLATLNGQFNAVVFRPTVNEIHVVTDRLASRPMYFSSTGQRHVFSTSLKGVRAALSRQFHISPVGLLELFAFGHNVGDKTVLDGIEVLPPGTVTTVNPKGVQQALYHEFRYSRAPMHLSSREWGGRISECLKSTIPKYLAGPARKGIFLSGGLDSRIVAASVANARGHAHAYTFGDPGTREVRFAKELARRTKFPHEVLPFPKNYLSKIIRDVVARTECATPFFHTASIAFHDTIVRNTDAILVGFGGSLSGSQLKRSFLSLSRRPDVARKIFSGKLCASSEDIAKIFQPAFFGKHWPETVEAFHSSFNTIDQDNGPDIADVWEIRNRQRRFTFTAPKVDRHRFEVAAPMLDNEFVDLMTTLPVDARWKQAAYRHAIVDGFPELRSVPWAKTGRPVPSGQTGFWLDESLRIGSKAVQIALSKSGLGGNLTREKYRDIAEDLRQDESLLQDHLYPRLADGSLPHAIFDPVGIRNLVDSHMNGRNCSHLLGTILTVAVYFGS